MSRTFLNLPFHPLHFPAYNFCFIPFYVMFSSGDVYGKPVAAVSILDHSFMLGNSLFYRPSSLTHINSSTLACYSVHNTLGVDEVCWGLDLRQAASQGESCFKDCPNPQIFSNSFHTPTQPSDVQCMASIQYSFFLLPLYDSLHLLSIC